MNKAELVTKAKSKLDGVTKKDLALYVDVLFESIAEALADGEEVAITGFGKFSAPKAAAHQARNPKTGEVVDVPEKAHPKFSASNTLKAKINA